MRSIVRRVLAVIGAASIVTAADVARAAPCVTTDESAALAIDDVEVYGLERTQRYVVLRELPFAPERIGHGAIPLSRADWDLLRVRLWNLGIFSRVDLRVEPMDGRCVAVVDVEERFTLNPLLRYAFGGRVLSFGIGAEDNNLFGRYLTGSVLYEYFGGYHGGEVGFKEPRLFDRRDELSIYAGRLTRPRPGFADARPAVRIELTRASRDDVFRGGIRVDGFADRFLDPTTGEAHFPDPTEAVAVSPLFRVGRIDTVRLRQTGASLELTPTFAKLWDSPVATEYAQILAEAMAFGMVGDRWNFALRVRSAGTTRVPDHLALYVGGLDLLRGFPDNYFRSRAYALTNAEARFTAFDSTWVALVPAVFVDAAAASLGSGHRSGELSAGGGVRILVPKLVNTGLRFDVAFPLTGDDRARPQPSFGVFQFFYGGMPPSRW